MTAKTTHTCDVCGADLTPQQAGLYAGIHTHAVAEAAGGLMAWHSCGASCAAAHLRDVAAKIEAHATERAAAQKAVDDNRAAFAKATAPGAPPVRAEVGTRVPK